MVTNDLQIRQKPGTNSLMQDYLSSINSVEDTLYAIIYSPMDCPRCEAAIPNLYRLLKENNHNMLLITVYKDSIMASIYNNNNNNNSDYYLYDTQNQYKQIFSFNTSDLYGLYVLKLCKSSGRMITGGQYTVLGRDFVSQLIDFSETVDYHIYESMNVSDENEFTARTPAVEFLIDKYFDLNIDLLPNIAISSVYDVMRFEDNRFFYSDLLNNGVMCFTEYPESNILSFDKLIQADSTEVRRFIEVSEKTYQNAINSGLIYHIACGVNMLCDNRIGISYSLPQIISQDSTESNIGLYNAPALISRNLLTWESDSLTAFEFNLFDENEEYFYMHFSFSAIDNNILVGCKKLTWPIEFDPEDYMDNVAMNPFCEDFYRTDNKIMAVFDSRTGKIITRFGHLEECHKQSHTGYYYFNPISSTYGNEIIYTDGYSGQLYVTTRENINYNKDHYSLFEVETDRFPPIDTLNFYTYEYVKPYNKYFDRCIEDIKITKDEIYCIVRYGMPQVPNVQNDNYTFVRIDRISKEVSEFRLPRYADLEILGYGLKNNKDGISPFIFSRKENNAFLRIFKN